MRFILTGSVVFILCIAVFNPTILNAAWPPDGLLVCGEAYDQSVAKIVSDGAGGAIIAWQDSRNPDRKIYAQRVDGSGNAYWTAGGIQVSGSGDHRLLEMVTDGAGGAILLWLETGTDVYAQRIDGSGAVQWTSGGVQVTGGGNVDKLVAVADGAGGVIVAYLYQVSGNHIYAQKLNGAGTLMWDDPPGHVAVSTASSDEDEPRIVADGSGGAIIAFLSSRAAHPEYEVYAQRIFSSGTVWTTDGVAVAVGDVRRGHPAIAGDAMGNAIIAWEEGLAGGYDILARRIHAGGTLQWPAAVPVCSEDELQETPDILDDGSGGAYIVWVDHRDDRDDIYAQRIDVHGNPLWTVGGVPVCLDNDNQESPRLLPCAAGCIAVWEDRRHHEYIYGQKLNIGGGPIWAENGVEVIEGLLDPDYYYDFDADGAGGILAAITADRGVAAMDIYAQSINCSGYVVSPEPEITGVEDVPGDQGGHLRVTITASDRDHNGQELEQVDHYDIWQRVDDPVAFSLLERAGMLPIQRIKLKSPIGCGEAEIFESESGRFLVTVPAAVQPEGAWEFIGSFDATQSGEYTYRTTTLADSSGSGIPYSVYLVSAHTTNPAVWFVSGPDSGYSVDNLPPGAPAGFTVAYNTGSGNALGWEECSANDFDYFRIFRGDDEEFIPSPENLVQSTAGTSWLDEIEDGYLYSYKITAVDYNGNESDASSPVSITGNDRTLVPEIFSLHQNVPNPFNPSTTISFDLPRATHVRLDIFNVKGEFISTLVDRHMDKGSQEIRWTAQDHRGSPVASGIYFYRLFAGDFVGTRKMILLR
ncbi:MAG: T9SS type A sorting domain-containing protein [Candidatus Krumholzibacteriota bacterium]|nr:T9SS type A sorting domain-containing protein [Candidatus Krumholzibacteriota bacterium]